MVWVCAGRTTVCAAPIYLIYLILLSPAPITFMLCSCPRIIHPLRVAPTAPEVAAPQAAMFCSRLAAVRGRALRPPRSLGRVRFVGEDTGLSAMTDKKARRAFRADPLLDGAASLVDQTVEGYSPEGFTINSIILPGTVLLLPQVSLLFHVSRLEQLTPDSLEVLRLLDPPIEMLIVGTGRTLLPLPQATEEWLAAHCIAPELLPTRHACSTFNFMGAEGRQVAAVLFPPVDPFADAALEAGPAAGEIT